MQVGAYIRRVLAQATAFFPIALLGLLALGSYVLYQQAPVFLPAQRTPPPSSDPDFFLNDFAARQFDAKGVLVSEIFGSSARHIPLGEQMEVTQAQMRHISDDGQVLTGLAANAVSNKDGSDVQLKGQVQVSVSAKANAPVQAPITFSSEYLHVLPKQKKINSDQPVRVQRGPDQFTAESLQYDYAAQVLDLSGRVKLQLHAHP